MPDCSTDVDLARWQDCIDSPTPSTEQLVSPLTREKAQTAHNFDNQLKDCKTYSHSKSGSVDWTVERLEPSEPLTLLREHHKSELRPREAHTRSTASTPMVHSSDDYFLRQRSVSVPGSCVATPEQSDLLAIMTNAASVTETAGEHRFAAGIEQSRSFRASQVAVVKEQVLQMLKASESLNKAAQTLAQEFGVNLADCETDSSSYQDHNTGSSRTPSLTSTASSASAMRSPPRKPVFTRVSSSQRSVSNASPSATSPPSSQGSRSGGARRPRLFRATTSLSASSKGTGNVDTTIPELILATPDSSTSDSSQETSSVSSEITVVPN